MYTLAVLALFGFVVLPLVGWMLRLACRIIGWGVSIALLPFWIMCLVVGGLALAARALLPLVLVLALIGLFAPEG